MNVKCEDLEKVAAICYYGRSGSLLLQSLLDSHPRVLMIPAHLMMGYFLSYPERYASVPKAEIPTVFAKDYACIFDGNDPSPSPAMGDRIAQKVSLNKMGPDANEVLTADRERFLSALAEALATQPDPVPRKALFQAIHIAYAAAIGRSVPSDPLIVYALHTPGPGLARGLVDDFPDVTILHMVREPLRSFASFLGVYKGWDPNGTVITHVLGNILAGGRPVLPEVAGRSFAVRLEDLHNISEVVMRAVARHVGLDWHDCLLESTFNGLKWWHAGRVSGLERSRGLQSASEVFTPNDVWRLQGLLEPKYRQWKYGIESGSLPALAERANDSAFHAALAEPYKFEEYFLPGGVKALATLSAEQNAWVRDWLLAPGRSANFDRRPAVPFHFEEPARMLLAARRAAIEYAHESFEDRLGSADEVPLLDLGIPHVERRISHCPLPDAA